MNKAKSKDKNIIIGQQSESLGLQFFYFFKIDVGKGNNYRCDLAICSAIWFPQNVLL
jgi:hypothetical protein